MSHDPWGRPEGDEPWRLSAPEIEAMRTESPSPAEADRRIAEWQQKLKWGWEMTNVPGRLDSELAPLLASLGNRVEDLGSEFERAEGDIDRLLSRVKSCSKWQLPRQTMDRLAERLIPMYERRRHLPGPLRGLGLGRRIAGIGRSSQVKEFMKVMLRDPHPDYRRTALEALNLRGWEDSDGSLFALAAESDETEEFKKGEGLMALFGLDRERALPVILKALEAAPDHAQFGKLSQLICTYGKSELLEIVLLKMDRMPKEEFQRPSHQLSRGIWPHLLLDYIKGAEDRLLELAIDVLLESKLFKTSASVLLDKLKSESLQSRIAIVTALRIGVESDYFISDQTRFALETAIGKEADETVLVKARELHSVLIRKLK